MVEIQSEKKRKLFRFLILAVLLLTLMILSVMLINLSHTVESLAKALILRTHKRATTEMNSFFDPVKNTLLVTKEYTDQDLLGSENKRHQYNRIVLPLFLHFPQLKTLAIANSAGEEFSLIREDTAWLNNFVVQNPAGGTTIWRYRWQGKWQKPDTFPTQIQRDVKYDPSTRHWFKGAVRKKGNAPYWSQPYKIMFQEFPGITISMLSQHQNQPPNVVQYDVLLTEISRFTAQIEISQHGKCLILSDKEKILGFPKAEKFSCPDSIKKYMMQPLDSLNSPFLAKIESEWKKNDEPSEIFRFRFEKEKWWCSLKPYHLDAERYLLIGVAVPESDFLKEVNHSRNIIIASFVIVLVFILIVFRGYYNERRFSKMLQEQKKEIEAQRDEILKQKQHITDSIFYASRIQNAILPDIEVVKENFADSFVLYLPCNIVSGDFYWFRKIGHRVLVVAADCTGHGVPGAFMSVLGISLLNEIANKAPIPPAGEILNQLRRRIKKSLQQTGKRDEQQDGMDISFCIVDTKKQKMQYAGAYNPLYLIRNNSITRYKADRMPIGIHPKDYRSFHQTEIQLQQGDCFYIFSDGYSSQFGGENEEKFRSKTFQKLLLEINQKPMAEQHDILKERIQRWRGSLRQTDDILVVGISI